MGEKGLKGGGGVKEETCIGRVNWVERRRVKGKG